ncbi:NosR/NirI family protein [Pseudolabrys sp. Root1462]|uniref:NosR/NirI family protein n=1 Tax=Pseudolabrys sp. Root1462 TaxID=1736466 RepID=UPI0009E8B1D5|nr:NosR/NirI family protein [Pseudolabrys sp. Root1462]
MIQEIWRCKHSLWGALVVCLMLAATALPAAAQGTPSRLAEFLQHLQPHDIDPAADQFGAVAGAVPAAPLLQQGKLVGYAFLNSDIVDSTGYSGKPINIVVGLDNEARITGAKLVEHHEPIFLVGIPQSKVEKFIHDYIGRSVLAADSESGSAADIVSGATVSSMVIGDSITRAAIKVAQAYKLGGGAAAVATAEPVSRKIDPGKILSKSWVELTGDGSVRRLLLTNDDVNKAFAKSGNTAAIARPIQGEPDAPFVDLYVALVSVPSIGESLLGSAAYKNLKKRLGDDGQAVLIAGAGSYSFRGSGYVRGGIFDRIEVIQGQTSIRFRDRDYERVGSLTAAGAPEFPEIGLFFLAKGQQFDPGKPWRLQLLVQRVTGALDKAFLNVGVGYSVPEPYLLPVETAAPAALVPVTAGAAAQPASAQFAAPSAGEPLWLKIWRGKAIDIAILLVAILVLTGIFFFQDVLVKRPKLFERIRMTYLAFTLLWLGWYQHAQLSVVNVFTFFQELRGHFQWEHFLNDPLIFILWSSVAAALLFWGRGAYCGWLCPFGALQEWMNKIARWLHVPQLKVPFGLHQRLWPIKYIIFLVLFGVSLGSLALAETLAEVEPFKTAIILHFMRDWWFVLIAVAFLLPGLFVERFYCRYMCPLGGALAIPARVRMFDWLRRYRECGSPCQRCAQECPVQAIHPEGQINPNECIQCMNCQVLYHHDQKCPVMIQLRLKREKFHALSSPSMRPGARTAPAFPPATAGEKSLDKTEVRLPATD